MAAQVWAGSKQKQLEAGSMQLMHQYVPLAVVMLAVLVPIFEPLGLGGSKDPEDTLLGFDYTPACVGAILLTAVLGLLVSLSTFLVIGATSSVTYNVVGHVKTVGLSIVCMIVRHGCRLKSFAALLAICVLYPEEAD